VLWIAVHERWRTHMYFTSAARGSLNKFRQLGLTSRVAGVLFQGDGIIHDNIQADDAVGIERLLGKNSSRVHLVFSTVMPNQCVANCGHGWVRRIGFSRAKQARVRLTLPASVCSASR
jgi:hypothetical protein